MQTTETRYINALTDFGFKKIFGDKEILTAFLTDLLKPQSPIKEITFLDKERSGLSEYERSVIYDILCTAEDGSEFIVEMQNVYQEFFKYRTIYYSTFPIREQAQRGGEWDFRLNPVYTIGLLNFNFADGLENAKRWHHEVKLMEVETHEVFYDKLTYIYVEIPKFDKMESELVTMYDKWMYVLKNLSRLMQRPAALQERVFTRLFEQAEIAKFNNEELKLYEDSMNAYRDIVNAIRTAEKTKYAEGEDDGMAKGLAEGLEKGRAEGLEKGRTEGITKVAINMLGKGMPAELVAEMTGLPIDEVQRIQNF